MKSGSFWKNVSIYLLALKKLEKLQIIAYLFNVPTNSVNIIIK